MKRIFCLGIILLAGVKYAHPYPTPDQFNRYAQELDVPVEALRQLFDAYHDTTGLTNPHAARATVLTLGELLFMRDSEDLKAGSYYRVRTLFNYQTGSRISLGDSSVLALNIDFMVLLPRYSTVDALFQVKLDRNGRPVELVLVEIAAAQ